MLKAYCNEAKQNVYESLCYNYSISIYSEGCVCNRAKTLDKVSEKLEEISPSENESENELLDENVAIAKTSKEVTIYISIPENGDITDEDSGYETYARLSNIPGNQICQKH